MTSFWGDPTYQPKDKDVARFVEAIRKLCKDQPRARALKLATSSLHAIVAYVVHEFGPREALALLDKMRGEVAGTIQ